VWDKGSDGSAVGSAAAETGSVYLVISGVDVGVGLCEETKTDFIPSGIAVVGSNDEGDYSQIV